ncbi:MAG: fibronectin type III domain-containing protein [Candidatus Nanopelagicales bacterium]
MTLVVRLSVVIATTVGLIAASLTGVTGPLPTAPPAIAAEPPPPPPIIDRNQLVDLNGALVSDWVYSAGEFEAAAVQEVVQHFSLPPSDTAAVMGWARDQVRAQMWADLGSIITNGPDPGRPYEADMRDWFRTVIQRENVAAAQGAVDEYLKYSGWGPTTYDKDGADPVAKTPVGTGFCNYQMPSGFIALYPHLEYKGWRAPDCYSKTPPQPSLFLAPKVPSDSEDGGLSTFVKLGQWTALQDRLGSRQYEQATQVSWGTANAINQGAALAAAGIGVPLAAKLTKGSLLTNRIVQKIWPLTARTVNQWVTAAGDWAAKSPDLYRGVITKASTRAAAKVAAKTAAKVAAKALARALTGSAFVAIDFIVTVVLTSIEFSQQVQLPKSLAKGLRDARTKAPNLASILANDSTYAGAFTSFLMATVPEAEGGCVDSGPVIGGGPFAIGCANAPSPPGRPTGDPVFQVTTYKETPATDTTEVLATEPSDTIGFISPLGEALVARASGKGWFVFRKLDPETGEAGPDIQSLDVPYVAWDGTAMVAQRIWNQTQGRHRFVVSPVDQKAAFADWCAAQCVVDGLRMVDLDGRTVYVTLEDPTPLDAPEPVYARVLTRYLPSEFRIANPDPNVTYTWRFECQVATPNCAQAVDLSSPTGFGPATATFTGPVITYGVTLLGGSVTASREGFLPVTTQLVYTLVDPSNVIDFPRPADMQFAVDPLTGQPTAVQQLTATAESLRPVTLTVAPESADVCAIEGGDTARAVGVGTCTITATQNGDATELAPGAWYVLPPGVYPRADPVTRSFTITKGTVNVPVLVAQVHFSDPLPTAAPTITTAIEPYEVGGELTGCTAPDWLVDAQGRVVEPASFYPAAGCEGLTSPTHELGYSAAIEVLPEDATLQHLSWGRIQEIQLRSRLSEVQDGTPGDVTQATVDFEVFASGNTGDTPDYVVPNVAVAGNGIASASLTDVPADTYRVTTRISEGSRFYAAAPVTGSVTVTDAAPAPPGPPGLPVDWPPAPAPDVPADPPADAPVGPPADSPAGPPADSPAGPPGDVPAEPNVVPPGAGPGPARTAPAAVTGLRAKIVRAKRSAVIRWQAPPGEVTGYRVRISRPDSTRYRAWRTVDATAITLRVLRGDARYRVQVKPRNQAGAGPVVTLTFRTGRWR